MPLGPIHPLGHLSRATIIRGGGLLARAIIDIPCRRRHRCRAESLNEYQDEGGGGRGGELPSSLSSVQSLNEYQDKGVCVVCVCVLQNVWNLVCEEI